MKIIISILIFFISPCIFADEGWSVYGCRFGAIALDFELNTEFGYYMSDDGEPHNLLFSKEEKIDGITYRLYLEEESSLDSRLINNPNYAELVSQVYDRRVFRFPKDLFAKHVKKDFKIIFTNHTAVYDPILDQGTAFDDDRVVCTNDKKYCIRNLVQEKMHCLNTIPY